MSVSLSLSRLLSLSLSYSQPTHSHSLTPPLMRLLNLAPKLEPSLTRSLSLWFGPRKVAVARSGMGQWWCFDGYPMGLKLRSIPQPLQIDIPSNWHPTVGPNPPTRMVTLRPEQVKLKLNCMILGFARIKIFIDLVDCCWWQCVARIDRCGGGWCSDGPQTYIGSPTSPDRQIDTHSNGHPQNRHPTLAPNSRTHRRTKWLTRMAKLIPEQVKLKLNCVILGFARIKIFIDLIDCA